MKQGILAKRRYLAVRRIETAHGPMPTSRIPQLDILLKLEFIAHELEGLSKEGKDIFALGLDGKGVQGDLGPDDSGLGKAAKE